MSEVNKEYVGGLVDDFAPCVAIVDDVAAILLQLQEVCTAGIASDGGEDRAELLVECGVSIGCSGETEGDGLIFSIG